MDKRRLLLELGQNLMNSSNDTVSTTSVVGTQGIWLTGKFEKTEFVAFLKLQDSADEEISDAPGGE